MPSTSRRTKRPSQEIIQQAANNPDTLALVAVIAVGIRSTAIPKIEKFTTGETFKNGKLKVFTGMAPYGGSVGFALEQDDEFWSENPEIVGQFGSKRVACLAFAVQRELAKFRRIDLLEDQEERGQALYEAVKAVLRGTPAKGSAHGICNATIRFVNSERARLRADLATLDSENLAEVSARIAEFKVTLSYLYLPYRLDLSVLSRINLG
ncbi:MAG: hypothetical protein SFX74_00765 [Fimbriimonadaceae bacterium]|nr:hypothetical protein [Fimbriimonadaceae bacterium]